MNDIYYLNTANVKLPNPEVAPKSFQHNRWDSPLDPEDYDIITTPTRCRVTINGSFVIPNVYVLLEEGGTYTLFRSFEIVCHQHYTYGTSYFSIMYRGEGMVLQFKSDNFIIERDNNDNL